MSHLKYSLWVVPLGDLNNELMNKLIIVPILALCFALPAHAQEQVVSKESVRRMEKDLYFLASDSLKGRLPGTKESDVARDFIQKRLSEFAIEPSGEQG